MLRSRLLNVQICRLRPLILLIKVTLLAISLPACLFLFVLLFACLSLPYVSLHLALSFPTLPLSVSLSLLSLFLLSCFIPFSLNFSCSYNYCVTSQLALSPFLVCLFLFLYSTISLFLVSVYLFVCLL